MKKIMVCILCLSIFSSNAAISSNKEDYDTKVPSYHTFTPHPNENATEDELDDVSIASSSEEENEEDALLKDLHFKYVIAGTIIGSCVLLAIVYIVYRFV